MTWREVIALDDKQLTEVGVAALGARRKFLKVFEHVKHEAELKGIPTDIKK
ncbi:Flap-structured DNA-binding and RNA-binding protein [Entomophthora muscae]|nr:Flap-structured DNA-binding and RNA-binding protein [Entomophthora muscae]